MSVKQWNPKALIGLGLMAGALQAAVGVAMYLAGVYFKPWSMFVTGLVLLLCIVVGTRWYSVKFLNDEITYKQALIVGVVISVSTGLVYAIYNIVSISFFYPRFLDEVARVQMAQLQTPESFNSIRAGINTSGIAMGNLIRLTILGSLFSVLCALFLRRHSVKVIPGVQAH